MAAPVVKELYLGLIARLDGRVQCLTHGVEGVRHDDGAPAPGHLQQNEAPGGWRSGAVRAVGGRRPHGPGVTAFRACLRETTTPPHCQ